MSEYIKTYNIAMVKFMKDMNEARYKVGKVSGVRKTVALAKAGKLIDGGLVCGRNSYLFTPHQPINSTH